MRTVSKIEMRIFIISVLLGLLSVVDVAHGIYHPSQPPVEEFDIYCTLEGAKRNRRINMNTPEELYLEGCWRVYKTTKIEKPIYLIVIEKILMKD